MRIGITVLCLTLTPSLTAIPQSLHNADRSRPKRSSFTHGTINLLLANKNGTVLITDSRISDNAYHPISDHAQKLFQLDSKTVCSIANFYSDPGPTSFQQSDPKGYPPLSQSIPGLIESFKGGLDPSWSVLQKADALAQYIGFYLTVLATSEEAHPGTASHTHEQELIVVGYDIDGTEIAVKRVISIQRNSNGHSGLYYHIEPSDTHRMTDDFFYIVGGVQDFAKSRLDRPDANEYLAETELNDYRIAHLRHTEENLTLKQLEALAQYLEQKSEAAVASLGAPVIGGDIQEATFVSGTAVVHPPKMPFDPYPESPKANLFINAKTSNPVPSLGSADHMNVLIDSTCIAPGGVMLDNTVIIGGTYNNCTLYFDGRAFYLDRANVQIRSATLVIGPHWNDQAVDFAIASLPPDITITCWKDFSMIPQNIQRAVIWNLGFTPDTVGALWNPSLTNAEEWRPVARPLKQTKEIENAEKRCLN